MLFSCFCQLSQTSQFNIYNLSFPDARISRHATGSRSHAPSTRSTSPPFGHAAIPSWWSTAPGPTNGAWSVPSPASATGAVLSGRLRPRPEPSDPAEPTSGRSGRLIRVWGGLLAKTNCLETLLRHKAKRIRKNAAAAALVQVLFSSPEEKIRRHQTPMKVKIWKEAEEEKKLKRRKNCWNESEKNLKFLKW